MKEWKDGTSVKVVIVEMLFIVFTLFVSMAFYIYPFLVNPSQVTTDKSPLEIFVCLISLSNRRDESMNYSGCSTITNERDLSFDILVHNNVCEMQIR